MNFSDMMHRWVTIGILTLEPYSENPTGSLRKNCVFSVITLQLLFTIAIITRVCLHIGIIGLDTYPSISLKFTTIDLSALLLSKGHLIVTPAKTSTVWHRSFSVFCLNLSSISLHELPVLDLSSPLFSNRFETILSYFMSRAPLMSIFKQALYKSTNMII